jgi:phage shock protein C
MATHVWRQVAVACMATEETVPRKLYRSRRDRMLCGVLGGLAEYFHVDSALVRVIFVLIALATGGVAIVAYVVMAIVVPHEGTPPTATPDETIKQNVEDMRDAAESIAGGLKAGLKAEHLARPAHRQGFIAGAILIVLGILFLLVNFGLVRWLSWDRLWPVFLIAIGALLVASMLRRRR